jgi:hypothetical protein
MNNKHIPCVIQSLRARIYKLSTITKISKTNTFKDVDKMPTIVHFDISAGNIERAKNFYNKLFGCYLQDNRISLTSLAND